MDIFTLLQIIIAFIFVFLIVSLLVSELQESLSAWGEFRAKNLKIAIENFVGVEFAENHLYNKSSVFSSFNQYTNEFVSSKSIGPSYIKPEVFAELILATVNKGLEPQHKLSPSQELFSISFMDKDIIYKLDSYKNESHHYKELIDRLKEIAYKTKLKKNNPTVKDFTNELANTFSQLMERTSGKYTRNAKYVSFILGIIVAPLFNIDTFHVVDRLYRDPELRQGFDDLATEIVEAHNNCLEGINLEENDLVEEEINDCQDKLDKRTKEIKESFAENQNLPIGWNEPINVPTQIENEGGLFQKIIGWTIGAIAIAMGAPFWFELLAKIVNVRNTVRPSSSQKENTSEISPDESVG